MPVTKTTRARRRTVATMRSMARISEHHAILGLALARWAVRDDLQAQPDVRRSADTAMDAIAAIGNLLAEVRSQLIQQIAASDAAAAVRVGADVALAGLSRPAGADASAPVNPYASSAPGGDASGEVLADASAVASSDASDTTTA